MTILTTHLLILPILLPLIGAIGAARLRGRWGSILVVMVAGGTAAITGWILQRTITLGPQVYQVGGWSPPQGIVLAADRLSAILALTAASVALAAAIYTLSTGEQRDRPLFHALFLLLLTALCGVFFTGDLFNLYVFMEMVILTSIILVAMARRPVAEVTFKYTLISALGSTLLLFSIALIYADLGTLNLADVARRAASTPPTLLRTVGGVLMLAVFLLKAGALPFHFWLPDAHSAAPTPISAMLSGVLVKVGVYGILRMTTLLFPDGGLLMIVGALGIVSALFGGLAALANDDLKRLLAYSTIANVGLILMGIGLGTGIGLAAALIHTVNHALIKGSLFLAGGYLAERFHTHSLHRLHGFAGLAPGVTLLFGIGALALAGLPPTAGFVSKVTLLRAGWMAGELLLLAGMVLASGLSIVYSLRVFVRLCWGVESPAIVEEIRRSGMERRGALAAALLVVLILGLGIWPAALVEITTAAANELQQPQIYIEAVLGENP
jgi:multicomponent Na+:H+ antiporter subunit D